MIHFNLRLFLNYKKITDKFIPDIILVGGITPLDFYVSKIIAKRNHAKIIYEVGDLCPLTPIELGGLSPKHPFIKIMQFAENYAYKNTDAVVSLLPCAEQYMGKHGLASGKFYYIPNGVVEADWKNKEKLSENHSNLIRQLKSENKTIVGYVGAHGIINSLKLLIDAVLKLKDKNIVLY